MGKNLIQQARGKGGPRYRAPSFRWKGDAGFGKLKNANAKILDIITSQGHAPLMRVLSDDGEKILVQAPEGIYVGQEITFGDQAQLKNGNVLALKDIPEGTAVFNIEGIPGDGGKFVKTCGSSAKVVSKANNRVSVLLPSNKTKVFLSECRACIGSVAGGGITEKPFLKAGTKYHAKRSKNKLFPIVCGVAMNSVDHPFGGKSTNSKGRPTQSSRNAPPGRKVGKIAPRRTGRKKR
ncbi:MAG: 50S ribosomal protein L2 [Nanoarchaeota archaeon]|nr:50S ribosomal protein L2 [Nanoarchaeota archaeon]MBU1704089.1 50S ribosomal protein L2 [Nanoarchaeota archaeon]